MSIRGDIYDFMRAFGQTIRFKPTTEIPDDERVLRARLVFEEAMEFVDAMGCVVVPSDIVVGDRLTTVVRSAEGGTIDLPAAADAIADLTYVVEGSGWTLGLNTALVFDVVHCANMRKLVNGKVVKDEFGKVVKPEGWQPPDIAEALRKQGWEG